MSRFARRVARGCPAEDPDVDVPLRFTDKGIATLRAMLEELTDEELEQGYPNDVPPPMRRPPNPGSLLERLTDEERARRRGL